MRFQTACIALLGILGVPAAQAGEPVITETDPDKELWIKPLIDLRFRYEYGDIDGFEDAHALTLRERIGFETKAWNGISLLVEGEFLQALVDDYHAGAPGADPFDPSKTLIADPENYELNQAYLQYAGFDTTFRVGRQRIVYDNSAFVSDGNWRQNAQTFDAISLTNRSFEGLTLNYAFVAQVNRMFGSKADAPLRDGPPPFANVQDVAANVHLFNASHAIDESLTVGGYVYLMDFKDKRNWDNNTFGGSVKKSFSFMDVYLELAWQDKAGVDANGDAAYLHTIASKKFGSSTISLGLEHLDAGFKMPIGTPHLFNGYADAFAVARFEGTHNGLTNVYLSHAVTLPWGINWIQSLHAMGDNEISNHYGWEYDFVVSKKLTDQLTAIAKFAYFEAGDEPYVGRNQLSDTTRFSIELNYKF